MGPALTFKRVAAIFGERTRHLEHEGGSAQERKWKLHVF